MAQRNRRFLFVPEYYVTPDRFARATLASDSTTREEEGRSVRQPTVDASNRPAGEIRPTLAGTPEVHVEGTIRLTASGPTDRARWGWVRDGDDATTDLQLRQSCRVLGRRPDVLKYSTDSTVGYFVRPKMLSLKSGRALLAHLRAPATTGLPLYSGFGFDAQIQTALLDPDNDTWSTPADIDVTAGTPRYLQGCDVVQLPDSGEILLLCIMQDGASPTERRLYCYYALDTDDWDGTDWQERSAWKIGTAAAKDTIATSGDSSSLNGCCAELLASGRVMVVITTEESVWSLVSDDRGVTWSATKIADQNPLVIHAGEGVSCARMRNDVVMVAATARVSNQSNPIVDVYTTVDGVSFGEALDIGFGDNPSVDVLDTAVAMRPDGFPIVYAAAHSQDALGNASTFFDALAAMTAVKRDPSLADDGDDLFGLSRNFWLFHTHEGTGAGDYKDDPAEVKYVGFVGVEAIEHRGQLLIAAPVVRQGGTAGSPTYGSAALMVYRAFHWQPLKEALTDATGIPYDPVGGYVYNRTWEPYGLPDSWGFAKAGAGTATISTASEGGYLETSASSNSLTYADTTLPAANSGMAGALRVVFRPVTGGSSTNDEIAVRLQLDDGGGNGVGVSLRVRYTNAGAELYLFDRVTDAQVGAKITLTKDEWIEAVMAVTASHVTLFCRAYDRTNDPDWDAPYETTTGDLTQGSITDELSFGTFATATAKCWWKTLQLHRTGSNFGSVVNALTQVGTSFVDSQLYGVPDGVGAVTDDGLTNYLRSSQITTDPRQWMCRGVYARWRGEAITEGDFDHATGYDYGGANVLQMPVAREWRSTGTGSAIEIVLDAGSGEIGFRPDAIALFGRNFPMATIQLNSADSWGSPTVSYTLGFEGDVAATARHSHLWALDIDAGGWTMAISGHRLTVTAPSGSGPWRPHQFRSLRTGPRFYVVIHKQNSGVNYVCRIEDNTEDTLILHSKPGAESGGPIGTGSVELGYHYAEDFAIFSDRLAVQMGHKISAAHQTGYRYLRLLLPACTHLDDDEAFYRLGYLLVGRSVEISTPDADWGWQVGTESGAVVTRPEGGGSYSQRRRSPRRTWSFGWAHLMPPEEAADTANSPATQPAKKTWGHWVDTVRRLEVDDTVVALVWGEGNRAVGQAGEAAVQVASDPDGLVLARLTSPGTIEQILWDCRTLNLPGGDDSVPRPMVRISGITFTEEV